MKDLKCLKHINQTIVIYAQLSYKGPYMGWNNLDACGAIVLVNIWLKKDIKIVLFAHMISLEIWI